MDISDIHIKIENEFSQGTMLNLVTTLNDSFNNLNEEDKAILFKWLEFEFLYEQISIYDTMQISWSSMKAQLSSDAKLQLETISKTKKRNIEYLQRWIIDNKSNNLKVELSEINARDKKASSNYLGQPANDEAIKFFEFLCENYKPEDLTKVKYVNILYFLKNNADKKHFIFNLKQDDYKKMVIKNIGIIINKFEKSASYEETEKHIFYSLENTFLKNMKV